MKILKELDRQSFTDRFTTKQDCYNFLAELKWTDGYNCKRCDSSSYIKGKQPASRRCSKSLKPLFDTHIKTDASILADGWRGYSPLKEEYPDLKQTLSNKGKNFKMLHIQIRNFKNWLRGVHSYCNKEYLQKYIDEYFFRFNRRNHRASILDKILERCAMHQPVTINVIKLIET